MEKELVAFILEDGNLFLPDIIKERFGFKVGEKFRVFGDESHLILSKLPLPEKTPSQPLEGLLEDVEFTEEDFIVRTFW
jgi:hypothetical protein